VSRFWPYKSNSPRTRLAAAVGIIGVAAALTLVDAGYPLGLVLVGLAGVLIAGAIPLIPKDHGLRFWGIFFGGLFLFTNLRAFADETPIVPKVSYVINLESDLFGGTLPTFWLHSRFPLGDGITLLALVATLVHWSWFIFPYGTTLVLYAVKRRWFEPYVLQLLGTLYLGLVLYFLLPTEPPWMASLQGYLPPTSRIMEVVGRETLGQVYDAMYDPLGAANAVAAMPSLHMAGAFTLFLFLLRRGSPVAFVALAYGAIMAFSLTYLAEHYVIDLIAGVATAVIAFALIESVRIYRARRRQPAARIWVPEDALVSSGEG
jgi:hypothetical protein